MEFDSYTTSLRERKGQAWEAYKSLVNAAAEENRDLTAEEVEQRDRIEADLDALNAEEKRHRERVATIDLADSIRAQQAPKIETSVKQSAPSDAQVLASIVLGERGGAYFNTPEDLKAAFASQRALGNTPDGGSALGETFSRAFVNYERTMNPVIEVATVLETSDNTPLRIPRKTADQAYGGTVTAEGAGIVAADPTLSSVVLYTYKYPSITFVSSELARSNAIGLEQIIAEGAARELALDTGTHFTTGDGSDKPQGFFGNATNAGTAAGTAVDQATDLYWGPSDLIDLFMSPAAPYRARGSWMLSTAGISKVRKMKDSNGDFLYNPLGEGLAGPIAGTILGKPVYENPAVSDPGSAVTTSIAFGDFSRFYVRRLPLRVDTDTSFRFQNDEIAIRTILEVDSELVDSNAIHYLVCQAV